MDKLKKLVGNGRSMRGLPPGFRFEPTEEELVFSYLKCKVFCCALPAASIIPDLNFCNFDPWDLPRPGGGSGDEEEMRYLFSNQLELLGKNNKGRSRIWSTPSGYWKPKLGCERKIVSSNSSSNSSVVNVAGMKNTLVFYITNNANKGRRVRGIRTAWLMHQYRLISTQPQSNHINFDHWVLCRIFFNKFQSNIIHINYNSISTNLSDSDSNSNFDSDSDSDSVSSTASSTPTFFNQFTSPTTTTTTTTTTPLQHYNSHHHHFSPS